MNEHVEIGQVGAGLSRGEGELGRGKAAGGRNQNDEIADLGKDWNAGEEMGSKLEKRPVIKSKKYRLFAAAKKY